MSRLLITGGTGSFGNAVAKHFLKDKKISEIIIFSRDEKKQHDMYHSFSNSKLKFVIGDIRQERSIAKACRGVDFIFHAAALKQVPTGEYFPFEMVQTNIVGTENVLNAAEENNVKKVVLLSTDKAVYPINAMGMTKALAEKLIGAHARTSKSTIFCSVRYGNVMSTRGSVIPLFVDSIKQNRPLLVTNPLMTRFLISLDDSINLVNLAISKGKQGDTFVMKAPAATVGDLAQAILNIFNAKNLINIIGLRAGEKIHETLVPQSELITAEEMGKYFCIHDGASKKYDEFFDKGVKTKILGDYTSENTKRLTVKQIEKLLLKLDFIKQELKLWQNSSRNH